MPRLWYTPIRFDSAAEFRRVTYYKIRVTYLYYIIRITLTNTRRNYEDEGVVCRRKRRRGKIQTRSVTTITTKAKRRGTRKK